MSQNSKLNINSVPQVIDDVGKGLSLLEKKDLIVLELLIKSWFLKRALKIRFFKQRTIITKNLIENYALRIRGGKVVYADFLTTSEKQKSWEINNFMIKGFGNIKLAAVTIKSWVHNDDDKWVIVVHGLNRNKMTSIFWAIPWLRIGYHVLVYDVRAHGDSEGTFCSFGWLEKQDLKKIQTWLINHHHPQTINFVGWSMGSFTVLEFLKLNYQPSLHKFALIDGPVDRFANLLKSYLKSTPNLDCFQHYPITRNLIWEQFHFDPEKVNPGNGLWSIKKLPILFMLNLKDKITPWNLGYRTFKNKIEAEKKVISVLYDWNCEHCRGIYLFNDRYTQAIKKFLTTLTLK